MLRRLVSLSVMILVLGIFSAGLASAEQRLWNVPSPDVLDQGQLNMTVPMLLRPWSTANGPASESTYMQGVYGLGTIGLLPASEVGLIVGPIDLRNLNRSNPFADASLKMRLFRTELSTGNTATQFEGMIGDSIGVGLSGATSGHVRNFAYGGLSARFGLTGTRISAGPYHATKDAFDDRSRLGGQFTFEQPLALVPGLSLTTDFQTGHNGTFTPGIMWTKGPLTLGVGYGLSNNGRKSDSVIALGSFTF